ncbi:MAG: hypothetical protein ACLGH6_08210 [Gammaproteobacteria bacterium]
MRALLIQPDTRSIEVIDIQSRDDIVHRVGYDTLESDAVGDAGDALFFDEACFLRGTTGRFQVDTLVPVSGVGVIVGRDGDTLCDAKTDLDALRQRIKYL